MNDLRGFSVVCVQNGSAWEYSVLARLSKHEDFIRYCRQLQYVGSTTPVKSLIVARGINVLFLQSKKNTVEGTVGFFFVCRDLKGSEVRPDIDAGLRLLQEHYIQRYYDIVMSHEARMIIGGLWSDRGIGRRLIEDVLKVYMPA